MRLQIQRTQMAVPQEINRLTLLARVNPAMDDLR
jgi:hypothetical protein